MIGVGLELTSRREAGPDQPRAWNTMSEPRSPALGFDPTHPVLERTARTEDNVVVRSEPRRRPRRSSRCPPRARRLLRRTPPSRTTRTAPFLLPVRSITHATGTGNPVFRAASPIVARPYIPSRSRPSGLGRSISTRMVRVVALPTRRSARRPLETADRGRHRLPARRGRRRWPGPRRGRGSGRRRASGRS